MPRVLNPSKLQHAVTARLRRRPRDFDTADLEVRLVTACLVLLAIGVWGPSIEQPGHYHAFADQRQLFGVPNLMDVLSNLAFAGFGVVGAWRVWRLWRMPQHMLSPVKQNLAGLFFAGLVVTGLCSGWYHLQPDDEGLAIDRYGMTIAFAGLLGLAAGTRVSDRSGQWLALGVLLCGASSIWIWLTKGNVLPWAVLQFGGMALLLGLACMPARAGALSVSWISVILVYVLAKLLEHADQQVYHFSHGLVSGHTLKHIAASCAALPVLGALTRVGCPLESPALDADHSAASVKHERLHLGVTSKGACQ